MPNNSCTVILNGHGFYTSTKVINLNASTIKYNIIFPCGLKESISAAHHNLIIGMLAFANPTIQGISLIENLTSSNIIKRSDSPSFVTDMDSTGRASRISSLVNEHILVDAPDVIKAHSFLDFNQQPTASFQHLSQKFLGCYVTHVTNSANFRALLNNDGLYVEFNSMQIHQDVLNAHSSGYSEKSIILSPNNLFYIKPRINFLLSDLISDILPKLKIVAMYHSANDSVDIISTVFLDDNSDNTLQQKIMATFTLAPNGTSASSAFGSSITFDPKGDVYHELTIAGDANILWDACRDPIAQ